MLLAISQLNSLNSMIKLDVCHWELDSHLQVQTFRYTCWNPQPQWLCNAACSKGCRPPHRFVNTGGSGANCPGITAEQGRLSVGNSASSGDSTTHVTLSVSLVLKLLLQGLSRKFSTSKQQAKRWPFLGTTRPNSQLA